jgi:hypothetical protein
VANISCRKQPWHTGSFRNGLDWSSLRKSGKNLDITGMDRSSADLCEDIVGSKLFAL